MCELCVRVCVRETLLGRLMYPIRVTIFSLFINSLSPTIFIYIYIYIYICIMYKHHEDMHDDDEEENGL